MSSMSRGERRSTAFHLSTLQPRDRRELRLLSVDKHAKDRSRIDKERIKQLISCQGWFITFWISRYYPKWLLFKSKTNTWILYSSSAFSTFAEFYYSAKFVHSYAHDLKIKHTNKYLYPDILQALYLQLTFSFHRHPRKPVRLQHELSRRILWISFATAIDCRCTQRQRRRRQRYRRRFEDHHCCRDARRPRHRWHSRARKTLAPKKRPYPVKRSQPRQFPSRPARQPARSMKKRGVWVASWLLDAGYRLDVRVS